MTDDDQLRRRARSPHSTARAAVGTALAATVGAVAVCLGSPHSGAVPRPTPTPSAPALTVSAEPVPAEPAPETGMQPPSADPQFAGRVSLMTQSRVGVLQASTIVARLLGIPTGTNVPTPEQDSDPGRPPTTNAEGVVMTMSKYRGWNVWQMAPQDGPASAPPIATRPTRRTIIAVHGGAYVEPPTPAHWAYYASLVRETGATVEIPLYPGALIAHAAGVIPNMADYFSAQIREHGAENVSVLGDSAGAAITLAATQELVRRGQPVPASLVLVSPWLDATMTDTAPAPYFDPFLNVDTLRTTGKMWAGNLSTRDPRVSPLFGSLAGLPPTYVYSGSVDLLYKDAFALSRKAAQTPG
ncbi:MAG: alpha/beta hydrolase fold domain-containing protein, partial [Gordonia sp.]|uniref:alpha/beta hydrolase fold domain-containing protein n=1 Tax=Gordonia sp. (in: high G+C Gram-positive bacteria) TaxID=84139 RepID=UPI001D62E235